MAKMFRWLKDRKKQKRLEEKNKKEDDYGFRNSNKQQHYHHHHHHHHQQQHSDYYGFTETNHRSINSESPYHIYEEINDLPDLPMCSELSLGKSQLCHSSNDLRTTRYRDSKVKEEGPYMVVPIQVQNNICNDRLSYRECTNTSQRRNSEGDVGSKTFNYNEELPLCTCMQRSNAVGIFKCTCNDNSRKFKSNSDNYADPWDTSNSSGESLLSSLSEYDLFRLKAVQRKTRHYDKPTARLDSSNSDTCSQSSKCSIKSRNNAEQEAEDTGCEYDMSTSSESDVSDYKTNLEKIEHNLILKQQVRQIIRSLSNNECDLSEDSSNTCDRSDLDSTTTVSASGRSSSVRTVSCSEVSDADVFADQSESDDSSGYYECTDDKNENRLQPEAGVSAIPFTNVRSTVQNSSLTSNDNLNVKELILLPTRVSHKKQKHSKHRGKQSRSEKDLSNILEDTEMYLLPASRRTSECSDVRVYRKPLLPPQSVPIYQDPYRSKTEGIRNNRLLSDLIRMNNDRQHMIRV